MPAREMQGNLQRAGNAGDSMGMVEEEGWTIKHKGYIYYFFLTSKACRLSIVVITNKV